MRVRATLKWVGLALLGILVAASVAVAASRLASREIGLASEPISAGEALAPAGAGKGHGEPNQSAGQDTGSAIPRSPSSPTPSTPQPTVPIPNAAPPAQNSGDDRSGGDHDADD